MKENIIKKLFYVFYKIIGAFIYFFKTYIYIYIALYINNGKYKAWRFILV